MNFWGPVVIMLMFLSLLVTGEGFAMRMTGLLVALLWGAFIVTHF